MGWLHCRNGVYKVSDLFVFTNQSTAHKSQNCICCCTCIFLEVLIRLRQETNLFYQEYCEACNIYQIRPQSLWSQSDETFTDLSGSLWTRLLCVTTQVKRKCCVCVCVEHQTIPGVVQLRHLHVHFWVCDFLLSLSSSQVNPLIVKLHNST